MKCFIAMFLLLVVPSVGSAAEPPEEAARFAAQLAEEGDYYRAISEYKRALFLAPEQAEASTWALAIGEAYRRGEQPEAAARQYEAVAQAYPALKGTGLLGAAKSYFAAAQYESAVARARQAAEVLADADQRREAHYLEGWALLQTQRDAEARAAFEKARGGGVTGEGARRIVEVMPQLATLPSKSPLGAGLLGLVPGLGHLYIGDVGTAMSALVWNGVFGWALYESVKQEQWSLTVVLGMFEAMWYGGSILGAISGAHRYNRDARLNAMEDLEKLSPVDVSERVLEKTP